MTKATLIRTTFNWGWLTGLEIQSIIIKAGLELELCHLSALLSSVAGIVGLYYQAWLYSMSFKFLPAT
jgi:hypothetical protein